MHSRDIYKILIDLLWFNVVHYSSLFQSFFWIYYGPYFIWRFITFLMYLYRMATYTFPIFRLYNKFSLAAMKFVCFPFNNHRHNGMYGHLVC